MAQHDALPARSCGHLGEPWSLVAPAHGKHSPLMGGQFRTPPTSAQFCLLSPTAPRRRVFAPLASPHPAGCFRQSSRTLVPTTHNGKFKTGDFWADGRQWNETLAHKPPCRLNNFFFLHGAFGKTEVIIVVMFRKLFSSYVVYTDGDNNTDDISVVWEEFVPLFLTCNRLRLTSCRQCIFLAKGDHARG